MRARITLRVDDREGNRSSCSIRADRPVALSALLAHAQAFEAAVGGITTGRIVSGSIALPFSREGGEPAEDSDVRDALLMVFEQGGDYSSILVPSPRADLPYDTTGPYEGIRIRQTNPGAEGALAALVSLMGQAANPDGSPFAVGRWVAGRMRNR